MKYLTLLFALFAVTAHSQTVTLGTEPCTATQVCFNVPNSGNWAVEYISDASKYGRLVISINGDIFDSGIYAYPNLASFRIYDAEGRPLVGSLNISIVRATHCVQSGRVCVYPTTVTLLGGKLEL